MDLIELHARCGYESTELPDIIGYISSMVEEDQPYEADPAQQWVDLIHQLHGILAGGMPATLKPKIGSSNR